MYVLFITCLLNQHSLLPHTFPSLPHPPTYYIQCPFYLQQYLNPAPEAYKLHMTSRSYHDNLGKQMAQIFYRYEDFMLNMPTALISANPNRQTILTQRYSMEKKGKTLGTLEERAFRIHQGQLKQIDRSGQERDLPFPKSIVKETIQSTNKTQLTFQNYCYRILMQFQQRTPIYVYFQSNQQLNEIYSFLLSRIHPQTIHSLAVAYEKRYKEKLINYVASKISTIKLSKNFGGLEKKRISLISKVRTQFRGEGLAKQLLLEWHKKAVMTAKDPEKAAETQSNSMLSVKNVVSELCLTLQRIKAPPDVGIKSGELKLWVGQMTHNKIVKFNSDQITHLYAESADSGVNAPKQQIGILVDLKGSEIKVRNENPVLSIWTTLQFQAETKNQEGQIKSWRSDRFYAIDLLKSLRKGPKIGINLWSGRNFMQLWGVGMSANCQALKICLPPEHEQFPSSYTYSLTPNMYPILGELIPKRILAKYIKSISPETIHLQYTIAFQEYLQNESAQSLSYSNLAKLYDLLQIDLIVDKFYSTQPYNQYSHVEKKGTFVYECLVRKSEKFAYYDAEKFIWEHQCSRLRRFFSAIKAFDEFPRINYTEPFYFLCLQCLRMAEKQSLIKWKSHMFANSLLGRQSLAFFMVLGILKCCSQLLLVQPNKSTLANNSLLFHYVLKKHSIKLYNKFLNLQLNIETLFGIESSSLFAGLLNKANLNGYGGGEEVFQFILTSLIAERREQTSKGNEQDKLPTKTMRNNHYVSLVSVFLGMLEVLDMVASAKDGHAIGRDEIVGSSCAYTTANSYIEYLRIFASTQLQTYLPELLQFYHKYYRLCMKELQEPEYSNLQANLQKFHAQNSLLQENGSGQVNNMRLSDLMEQLYSEFSCSKPKNEEDIRKITIILDSINLGEYLLCNTPNSQLPNSTTLYRPASLMIQVLQSSTKLYEHEYIIPHKQAATEPYILAYDNMKHQVEVKLSRLSPLTLLITYSHNNNNSSYGVTIDPREIPSNYYVQQVKDLMPVMVVNGSAQQRVTEVCSNNRYVCLQIYIKDSSEVDYLENSVPSSYINGLLLRGRVADNDFQEYRKDVIFCNHYFRSFRLVENNFNLLYAKLGWYGNHYLIPTDRINHMHLIHPQLGSPPRNTQVLADLANANIAEYSLVPLPQIHRQRLNQILFYSRCIYGRGLVPAIGYAGSTGTQVSMESVRSSRTVVRQTKEIRNEINQCQYNSCGNLVGYLLENFNTISHDSSSSFIDFYLRCTQELPLIRYLSFHPLEFYLLQQLAFTLQLAPEAELPNSASNLVKNKAILPPRKAEGQNSPNAKSYQVILTNHPLSPGLNSDAKVPHKFISNPTYFNQELYANYEAASDLNPYNTKDLYLALLQSSSLPTTFYFTYPEGIEYRFSHEDVEGIGVSYGVSDSTEMLVDQFLWLLQMNIIKYYIVDAAEGNKEKEKQRGKNREKEKEKEKKISLLGCQIRLGNSTIPNTSMSCFYQLICQTKLRVDLIVSPISPILFQEATSSGKNAPSTLLPLILNPIYRHYTSFAFYNGIWVPVCVLAKLLSPNYLLYYVEEKFTRKYKLMRSSDVVLGLEAKRMLDRLPSYKFTDYEVLTGKECVRRELIRVF